MKLDARLRVRRDTAANWAEQNPVMEDGEIGAELDTRQFKLGDGVTVWNELLYQLQGAQGERGDVGLRGASGDFSVLWANGVVNSQVLIADGLPQLVDGWYVCAPVPHNLGHVPAEVRCFIKCKADDGGCITGDVIFNAMSAAALLVVADAVNVRVVVRSSAWGVVTPANWELWAGVQ